MTKTTAGALLAQPRPNTARHGTRSISSGSSAREIPGEAANFHDDPVDSLGHQSGAHVNLNDIDPPSTEMLAIGHVTDQPPSAPPTTTADLVVYEQQAGTTSDPRGQTQQVSFGVKFSDRVLLRSAHERSLP